MHRPLAAFVLGLAVILHTGKAPLAFWDTFDARNEPLQVEVIKAWSDAIGHYQLVRYHVATLTGSNRTASPIMAAYYGYPKDAENVPGIVQIHGGGQRASKGRVTDWVRMGYACISINWGGNVLEEADTPNTDWDGLAAGFRGSREQKHHNSIAPGENTLHREPHMLNSSWNLIALSARRGLTFLEQRPEVDPAKLGVEGHSMGGRSTVLTAIDPRVKAAAPSVGGSGYLYRDLWGLPGSRRHIAPEDLPFYEQVVSAQAYWPRIKAPVLFLGATNDFNSPTDWIVRGMAQLPAKTERMLVLAAHLNHRFTTETAAARWVWMEAHLKGTVPFPKQSPSSLNLDAPDHIPRFTVTVDPVSTLPVEKVEVYYGYARDPRIRYWRSGEVSRDGSRYTAACPVFDVNEPLFAFANITYRLPFTLPQRPGAPATDRMTVTSQYQTAYPPALEDAGVVATEKPRRLIDDFGRGWQDWYRLNPENSQHFQFATRKIVDPGWMGPKAGTLAVDVVTNQPGARLAVGLEVNTWQGYTGRKSDTYHALVTLPEAGVNPVSLRPGDFRNSRGKVLADWDEAVELLFQPAARVPQLEVREDWPGEVPELRNLRWEGGEFVDRPYPHQPRGPQSRGTVAFEDEFQQAIDDSLQRERLDRMAAENGRIYLDPAMASEAVSLLHVARDQGWAGEPISVGGQVYKRGLGVHAVSKLVFPLDGKFTNFHVVPGPDDGHHGLVEMRILVDGREQFTTGQVRSRGFEAKPLDIAVAGAKTLTLLVDQADGNNGGDHASWADAYLENGSTK